MQLRFQLQGRSSVTKGKQGRVKETEGVLNGAVYSHCHGFFSVQKIIRLSMKKHPTGSSNYWRFSVTSIQARWFRVVLLLESNE
ncbi:hypothetical protein AAZX31_18G113800 [Glycine max]